MRLRWLAVPAVLLLVCIRRKQLLHTIFRFLLRLQARACRLRPPGEPGTKSTYSVRSTQFMLPMADGVALSTTLREACAADTVAPGTTVLKSLTEDSSRLRLPVVFLRTPYSVAMFSLIAHVWAQRGYHVVQQDTRGRFDSQGEFSICADELPDGLYTVQWIRQQEWCDGHVGMFGVSYDGYCAWAALAGAVRQSPDLPLVNAIVPVFTSTDLAKVTRTRVSFVHLVVCCLWLTVAMCRGVYFNLAHLPRSLPCDTLT